MRAYKINYIVFGKDRFVDKVWANNEDDATLYFNMFFSDMGAVITSIDTSLVQFLIEKANDN
tara:strand:+ start:1035 stop:1220 length:186 start_codon:yes stop_codon:yes gene_type:complete